MYWSTAGTHTKSRAPGTTHYQAPKLSTVRPKTPDSLTISAIGRRPVIKETVRVAPKPPVQESDPNVIDPITSKYISNLQGQIHLLELESKILKERVSASENAQKDSLNLEAVDPSDVDPTIRELKMMYQKLERDAKTEKQV